MTRIRRLVCAIALAAGSLHAQDDARVDLDLKEADIAGVARLFAEIGGLNIVLDPDVSCSVTVRLREVAWPEAFRALLSTCGLAEDRVGDNIVRIASRARIRRELEERRRYQEEKALAGPLRTTYRRLSYARAKELAPLVERFLSPRGSVQFDERTNLLIIRDVERDAAR